MSNAIVPGSLSAIAQRDGISVAESFLTAEIVAVVDVSGSMDTADSRGHRKRYDVACEELAKLQQQYPGKVAVVAFSDTTQFAPGGVPPFLNGSTDLATALKFVRVADGTVRFVVISDGYPDDEEYALAIARTFTSPIDCVYVGPEYERSGADFLERLARASRGQYTVAARAQELCEKVQTLMLTGARL